MTRCAPDFIDSPYLIIDENGWRLKEDAPEELKKEFDKYMKKIDRPDEFNQPF